MRMTRTIPTVLSTALALALLGPGAALAEGAGSQPGAKAADQRSDVAADKSNAQWSEGAEKGQDRAASQRSEKAGEHGKTDDAAAKGADEETGE